ncbi:unnamed protein product, partial [marine sediment metagenome]
AAAQTLISASQSFNNLTIKNTSASGVILADALSVGGNLYLSADGANNVLLDAATNNPDVAVTGDLDFTGAGGGTESISMGNSTWTVGGDVNFTDGTIDDGSSTLVMNGDGKTLTANSQILYNLTLENNITFADSFTVANLFKCITASKTLTFTSGQTYTLNDIELDGQAVGTRVTLAPLGGTAYNWNVTADPQTDVSYVDVSYCNASTGSEIDASNGTNNDGDNNLNWDFGVTISGTCRQYDQSSNCADAETVRVAINGVLQAETGTTSTGSWSISYFTLSSDDV